MRSDRHQLWYTLSCAARVALTVVLGLAASRGRPAGAQAKDAGARMERVADGVYAIIHDDATDQWPHGNTGVIVGDEGVVVVDAAYLPSRARADIALIRSVTDKPVRYLVITHWHFDHNNGTVAYRDAFPGVAVVSERATRDYIELNATWWARMSTAPGSARRASLAQLEEQLRAGKDSAGRPLARDSVASLERSVRQRRAELEELASLRVVPPNLVFDRELALTLGRRRIELRDRGRANSPHDVTVYLPDERVLFTGDIVVQAPVPYLGASWPVPWIDVLRELEAVPVTALVPGHGPVMRDHAYARQVRELLEAATARVDTLARRGRTLEQVQDSVRLEDVRARVAAWRAPELGDVWTTIVRVLVERVWRGIRGQG
jgi:cyclase